jgi:carbon monoxide dehydrogenase subunit G
MITINASRDVSAPLDRIWNIVADVDNEPRYWHGTKTVKNISKIDYKIEREVTIAFKDSKCRQTVLLNPLDNHKTRIDVIWNIKLAGFLGVFTGIVKRHIAKGTDEALVRIAEAVE